jgi:hypothetical protein
MRRVESEHIMETEECLTRARELFLGEDILPPAGEIDPVNQPAIRRWAEAMEDKNPLWHDPAVRKRFGFKQAVAPPAMLFPWVLASFNWARQVCHKQLASPSKPETRPSMAGVLVYLRNAGYTGNVATNFEQEYVRYLHEGDMIYATSTISEISDEKHTSLGAGVFVTITYEFKDRTGAVVGRQMMRMLQYKPAPQRANLNPA